MEAEFSPLEGKSPQFRVFLLLLFAVAGAGKTTAMVHRIERLVRDAVFRPGELLATSFGRANVRDLKVALANWPHCNGVDSRTLHSLGRDIIKQAQQMGRRRRSS